MKPQPPSQSSPTDILRPKYTHTQSAITPPPSRRQLLKQTITSASTAVAVVFAGGWVTSPVANAATTASGSTESNTDINTASDFVSYTVEPFVFELPKSWKVIVNKKPSSAEPTSGANKKKSDGKIFSAIDFSTGAVVTIVEERTCSPAEYAADIQQCDIVVSSSSNTNTNGGPPAALPFSSPTTLSKDMTKLLIRHDDRDNAALQGTTALESVTEVTTIDKKNSKVASWDVVAVTSISIGGTYTDTMGLEQPNILTRTVQTKVLKFDSDPNRIISMWVTAPTEDWGKPVSGMKLRQTWKSITVSSS